MSVRAFAAHKPRIAVSAYVDAAALVVGQVSIGEDSSLWPMSVARGDIQTIRIGARSNIQDGSVLHVTHDGPHSPGGHALHIGDEVTVGHSAILHGCRIEDLCLIGMGSVVMDGALLKARTMLGAGSLVTPGQELTGQHLWMGRPARRVRALSEQEIAYLSYSAAHYVALKERHRGTSG